MIKPNDIDIEEQSRGQPDNWFRAIKRYTFAIGCVLTAFLIRFWLNPLLGEELPLMLFVAASLVASWYGGAVPGVVALFVGLIIANEFFFPAKQPVTVTYSSEALHVIRYFFTALFGIVLIEVLRRDHRRIQTAVDKLRTEMEMRQRSEEALRRAQDQLRQHAAELEERVQERTARLSATNEALRDLLYHIAHNLRAPLRAVEGYSTLLEAEFDVSANKKAAAHDYLRRISEASTRMDQLINDLLQYGRLGHSDVDLKELELKTCVTAVLQRLAPDIKARKARVDVQDALPKVTGNPELLENALLHLFENALQFVGPGVKPHVRVSAEVGSTTVRLWIEDNGIGIDPRYHERIFGVFERLYPTQDVRATGMGLAIVKQSMQRMHGKVGVDSHLGAGSRFWLEFPKPQ